MTTIKNGTLEVTISEMGAELMSIKRDGKEYLYQADEKWPKRAPILFPWAGRIRDYHYTLDGEGYDLGVHGFVRDYVHEVEEKTEDSVLFRFESREENRLAYPRDFVFHMGYRVIGDELELSTLVENLSDKEMPCGLGYHPGFLYKGDGKDVTISLEAPGRIERRFPNGTGQLDGRMEEAPRTFGLEEVRRDPTMILSGVRKAVLSASDRTVTLDTGSFGNLILWKNGEDHQVCLEVWANLPSAPGEEENFNTRSHLIRIPEKGTYRASCRYRFH